MIYRIVDLITEVPAAGGLDSRCREYFYEHKSVPDIVIREQDYRKNRYPANINEDDLAYMESAYQFYKELVKFDGMYLHSSAVVLDGKAYLFSGHCGAGKSTHTRLWQKCFGDKARVINDDKPALRKMDEVWYAYGTPWCGKDGINLNEKAPLAGICFLKKSQKNNIRRLSILESMERVLAQTIRKFDNPEMLDMMLKHMEDLLTKIPVYELENLPVEDAALLSHEVMHRGAVEAGL